AREMLEESLAIIREVGDRWGTTRVLASAAQVALDEGDMKLARVHAQECLDIARPLGGHVVVSGLLVMAIVVLEEGDGEAAAMLCREALATVADRASAHDLVETAACAECASGKPIRAAVIWGHLEALTQDVRVSLFYSRVQRLRHERSV